MTPREIAMALKGYGARVRADHDRERSRLHEAAHLVAWSFHDPKKFPKFEATPDPQRKKAVEATEYEMVRGFFMRAAMSGKKHG